MLFPAEPDRAVGFAAGGFLPLRCGRQGPIRRGTHDVTPNIEVNPQTETISNAHGSHIGSDNYFRVATIVSGCKLNVDALFQNTLLAHCEGEDVR